MKSHLDGARIGRADPSCDKNKREGNRTDICIERTGEKEEHHKLTPSSFGSSIRVEHELELYGAQKSSMKHLQYVDSIADMFLSIRPFDSKRSSYGENVLCVFDILNVKLNEWNFILCIIPIARPGFVR